ncbi:MAG TPA: helix-turn-helix transcriptional regulator [Solirubrobacterales bacterium]|jgi:PadR family transcriptional regulator, regulatory protein PadR|nr:helix-turn-helix transcriptional regulator [Solirubrobacterales bacterium]
MPHSPGSGLPRDYLRPCLLLLLREGSAHGYELLERVGDFGFDHSDPGALYRVLRKLEAEGKVASSWENSNSGPQKRVYTLTETGIEELDRRATDLAEGERRIGVFLTRYLRARRLPSTSPKARALLARRTAAQKAARVRRQTAAAR